MHPVGLFDLLNFDRGGRDIKLTCNDPILPVHSRNLVFRAAALFLKKAAINEGVRIHLEKRIPISAGLGGGSGNAAATFLALNELFGHPLTPADLQEMAAAWVRISPFFYKAARACHRPRRKHPAARILSRAGVGVYFAHPSRLWNIHFMGLPATGPVSRSAKRPRWPCRKVGGPVERR